MARKSKTSNRSASHGAVKGELGLSELHIRLNFLRKENEKLIAQIETTRTNLNKLMDSIQEVGIAIAQRVAPYRQRVLELDRHIHQVFKEISTNKKLGKKTRKEIQSFYYHLQLQGLITPQNLSFDSNKPNESKVNDFNDSFDDTEQNQSDGRHPLKEIVKPDRDELKKIRQLFLRLAENFHPDKVTEPAEKEYRTEIMKEINLAYQNADLARLLTIEKQQELEMVINFESSDDLTRNCAKVEAENTFLKDQLTTLKQELKLTKKTQQGELTANFLKITKHGGDPIGEALHEIEEQISLAEDLEKLMTDFRDRRITVQEFLRCIKPQKQNRITEEELIMEFLSQFR